MNTKLSQKKHNLDTKKVAFKAVFGLLWVVAALITSGAFCMINAKDVLAEAKASTITLGVSNPNLSVNLVPSAGGTFAASSDSTISVKTDNFTGYTLMVAAQSDSARDLSDGSGHSISSLDSAVSASDFASSSSYNNRWGFKPSQYVSASGNNSIIINNNEEDKYLPAPTALGTTIATTITANTTPNTYTYSFGARASESTIAGAYSGTFIVTAIPNNIIYNITFNKNASSDSTVTNIPAPQGATISGGTSTSVTLSSTIPSRVGYNFAGWCDTPTTNPEGVGPQVCSGNTYAAGASYGIDQTIDTTDIHLYAIWTPKTYTATFYYNQDSDSGETDIKTATATCTVANAAGTCQPTIPNVVTSSVGTYNNAYVGVANTTGTMNSSTNVTISGDTTFYAVYRSNVTLYHPSSTSARTSKALYRNQYFTSTSAMSDTVLSSSTTGTSNYAPSTPVSGYNIYGYATSASTNTKSFNDVPGMAANNGTTYYMILAKSVTATFYYNNNTNDSPTSYTAAVTSTTASGNQYIRCTSSAAEISNGNISVPTAVSNSKGTHGENYLNVGTSTDNMAGVTPTTGATTYYTRYSDTITIYRAASETTANGNLKYYRNQRVTGTASSNLSTAVLATSNTTITNATYSSAVSNYSLSGFATSTNTSTTAYNSVQTAAEANAVYNALYAVETRSVTATFYYNNRAASDCTTGTSSVTSTTSSGTRTLYTTSTTAATTAQGSIAIPSAVSSSAGTYCNAYAGVNTSAAMRTSSVSPTTANTTYYTFYRTNVTIVTPSSTSAAGTATRYRNQYVSSTSAMSTTVLSDSNTGTSNYTQTATVATNYSLYGFANAASRNNKDYADVAAIAASTATKAWAVYSRTNTGTFYYQSNTTAGSTTISSKTATATQYLRPTSDSASGFGNTNYTIPDDVKDTTKSMGTYNNTYVGVATATGTMSSSTTASTSGDSGTNTFYAVYRTSVTLYYPSSASARTSKTLYRNQWFTGTNTMATTVLSDSTTGTSNYAPSTPVTNYTITGYAASASTSTVGFANVAAMAANTGTTYYMILNKSLTATFYYQSNTTAGSTTVSSKTSAAANQYIRCTASAAEISNSNFTIPDDVKDTTKSMGTYNNTYVGVAGTTGTMSTTTPNTGDADLKFYAVYRTNVTIVTPSSTSAAGTATRYRNQWFTSDTAMATTVLSDSTTGTANYTQTATVATNYNLYGFANAASRNNKDYANVAAVATNTATKAWAVYNRSLSAKFCYNNNTTPTSGTSSVTSANKSASQYLRATSDSAAGLSNSNYSPPTGHYGTYNNALAGWATAVNSMTTTTPSTSVSGTDTCKFYAVYRTNVTNYYYTGSAYSNRTLYRNQTLSSTSAMGTTYLSTSSTGLSNYSTTGGPGSSTWYGLSTALSSTSRTYSSVAAAATSTSTTLNSIYQFTQNFSSTGSTGVTGIGSTVQYCYVSSTAASAGGTSCSVTTPTISVDTGYTSLGWGTQGHTSSGTAAGNSYTVSTSGGTLYANAKLNTYNLVITGDANVSAMSVKKGSTSGTTTTCSKSGTNFTCSALTYGTKYYLYPTFASGYQFSSWTKTDSASGSSLGSTTTENTYYQMGAGAGAVTLASKASTNPHCTDWATCMQNTSSGCDKTLTDGRDGATYTTATIAGTCWMTQNLRFTGAELKVGESDVTSDITMTYGQLTSGNSATEPRIATGSTTDYGTYYNYCAVSAGEACNDTTQQDATRSVCPAGWKLPTQAQLSALPQKESHFTASSVLAGNYSSGSLNLAGIGGYWWASTAGSAAWGQYRLSYFILYEVWSVDYSLKYTGFSVRCVRAA